MVADNPAWPPPKYPPIKQSSANLTKDILVKEQTRLKQLLDIEQDSFRMMKEAYEKQMTKIHNITLKHEAVSNAIAEIDNFTGNDHCEDLHKYLLRQQSFE